MGCTIKPIFRRSTIHCDRKFEFHNFSKKLPSFIAWPISFLNILGIDFMLDGQGHCHIYGIDRENLVIFGIWVHIGMRNNSKLKFHLDQPKSFICSSPTLVNRSLTKASENHSKFKIAQNLLKPSLMAYLCQVLYIKNNKSA